MILFLGEIKLNKSNVATAAFFDKFLVSTDSARNTGNKCLGLVFIPAQITIIGQIYAHSSCLIQVLCETDMSLCLLHDKYFLCIDA